MNESPYVHLSKRERQIMQIMHELAEASVMDVMDRLPDPPTYNAVRRLINILEEKGHLQHREEKNKYIYSPVLQTDIAKKSALDQILTTYFNRSVPQVVSTLLDTKQISEQELDELAKMIEEAKKQHR